MTSSESFQLGVNALQDLFMKKLTSEGILPEFSLMLAAKKSDSARVKHCYQYLHRYQLLPKKPTVSKSDQLSAGFRDKGNTFYTKKLDKEALVLYNNALMYAATSNLMSLAYANRSACLFSLKKYTECLLDIERAFEAGYNDELKPKLERRKTQCEDALKRLHSTIDEDSFIIEEAGKKLFRLSEKRMAGVPCASASLEISYSSNMGRSIIASEDILPGQVLAVEHPYMAVLRQDNYKIRCFYCCTLNSAMIPCENCPYVMFCNEECRSQSWNLGHKFECSLMSQLINMDLNKIELLSLRVLLQARCQHSSWKHLFGIIDLAEKESDNKLKGFVCDSDGSLIYDSKYYTPIHMLETNIEKRKNPDIFHRCFVSAVFVSMLRNYCDFFAEISGDILDMDEDSYLWRAGGLLFHHNMTSASNMHCIEALQQNSEGLYLNDSVFASGAYAFLSLFNHSCSPNVGRIHSGIICSVVALRPIRKGQQIFDNYGHHHALSPVFTRRHELELQYKFSCKCEACTDSWPQYIDLKPAHFSNKKNKKKFLDIISSELIEKLQRADKKSACNVIDALYKYATILEECAPCKELADHQETIKQCWALFGNIEHNNQPSFVNQFENLNL